jgi:hypothetical protein
MSLRPLRRAATRYPVTGRIRSREGPFFRIVRPFAFLLGILSKLLIFSPSSQFCATNYHGGCMQILMSRANKDGAPWSGSASAEFLIANGDD